MQPIDHIMVPNINVCVENDPAKMSTAYTL